MYSINLFSRDSGYKPRLDCMSRPSELRSSSFPPTCCALSSVSPPQRRHGYLFLSFAAALKLPLPFVFSEAFVIANDTGVMAGGGAGVLDLDGAAERLCAMCALTKCPAARAEQSESSPARVAAPMTRARRRALSPGLVGWEPRTPRRSSMAD